MFLMTSCLERNFVELDTYNGCNITSIQGVYYRYKLDTKLPGSGENQVAQSTLQVSNAKYDTASGACTCDATLPSNFPESQKGAISANNLVVVLNISTAAVIKPVGSAPALGTPGDWSKANQYEVIAADGTKKTWTVTVNFSK